MNNVVKLSKEGWEELQKILRRPVTKLEKKRLIESKGMYEYYKSRWEKKK